MIRRAKLCQRDYSGFSRGGDRINRSYRYGALLRLCRVETTDFFESKEGNSDEEGEINMS